MCFNTCVVFVCTCVVFQHVTVVCFNVYLGRVLVCTCVVFQCLPVLCFSMYCVLFQLVHVFQVSLCCVSCASVLYFSVYLCHVSACTCVVFQRVPVSCFRQRSTCWDQCCVRRAVSVCTAAGLWPTSSQSTPSVSSQPSTSSPRTWVRTDGCARCW